MPKTKERKIKDKEVKKRVIPAKTLAALMLTLVGILIYNSWQRRLTRNSSINYRSLTPSPVQKEIADTKFPDWESYTNEEYNFSLKYPTEWNFKADTIVANFPIFYFSKEKIQSGKDCRKKTSCFVVTPSDPGRGSFAFDIRSRQKKIKNGQVSATKVDYYAYNGGYYSTSFFIESSVNIPTWTDGVIDIYPKILDEKFSESEIELENGEKETLQKLESTKVDKADVETLGKIFSTIEFGDEVTDNN